MVLLSLSLWLRVLDLDLSLKDPLTDLALDFRLIESRCFRNFKSGSRSSGLVRRLFSSFSEVLGGGERVCYTMADLRGSLRRLIVFL